MPGGLCRCGVHVGVEAARGIRFIPGGVAVDVDDVGVFEQALRRRCACDTGVLVRGRHALTRQSRPAHVPDGQSFDDVVRPAHRAESVCLLAHVRELRDVVNEEVAKDHVIVLG